MGVWGSAGKGCWKCMITKVREGSVVVVSVAWVSVW